MADNTVRSRQIVVYCDESCHDLNGHHDFMVIGSLWMPRDQKSKISKRFRTQCRSQELRGEVKWSKASAKRLAEYRSLVDFFFDDPALRFRCIVVEQKKLDMEKFHARDRELAFYKFYYEMLEKWLEPGHEYLVLLDEKRNKGADRYKTLRIFLERFLRGKAWIADLTVINSSESPLAQLCDLLTGAVAAAYNGIRAGSPKEQLAQYIASRAGFQHLRVSTVRAMDKFNIFKIDLA